MFDRHYALRCLKTCNTDNDFFEMMLIMLECKKTNSEYVMSGYKEPTPNDLLKDIFNLVNELQSRLEAGEEFIVPSLMAKLAFYKSKYKEEDEQD